MLIYLALLITFTVEFYRCIYPNDFIFLYEKINQKIRNYEERLSPIIAKLCYNVIYCYSYIQIKVIKFKIIFNNTFMPYISIICSSIQNLLIYHKVINSPMPVPKFTIEIYKGGERIESILADERHKIADICNNSRNCDNFIILSDYSAIETYTNKIHYTNFYLDMEYKLSNIKFFSLDLMYNNETYPIVLKTDAYNHYIVNNVINSDFFIYYLKKYANVTVQKGSFEYTLTLLDHNVNFIMLTSHDEIIIKENDYEIRNTHMAMNTDIDTEQNTDNSTDTDAIVQNNQENNSQDISEESSSEEDIDLDKLDDFIKLELPE